MTSKPQLLATQGNTTDVLLVFMPFGNPMLPSLGLSLLKAELAREGVESRVAYYNLDFADLVEVKPYVWLSQSAPQMLLLGEWVFSNLAFGSADRISDHTDTLLRLIRAAGFDVSPGEASASCESPPTPTLSVPYPAQPGKWQLIVKDLAHFGLSAENLIDKLLDAREKAEGFVDACVEDIISISPKIVGFSSMFCQVCSSLAVARRVKERLGGRAPAVIFGGPNCEGIMGRSMLRAFPWIDFVCLGEGDRVFAEFVKRFLTGECCPRIRGVLARADLDRDDFPVPEPIVNMDALPFPNYEDYFFAFKRIGLEKRLFPLLPVETSRGCWWGEKSHCTFCGLNGMTMTYRTKTPERVLNEFEHLSNRYGVTSFQAVDNILNPEFFKTVFPKLIQDGITLSLFFETKSNIKSEQVRMLKDAGVGEIQPGIESFSDSVLRLMGKGVTGLQNILLLRSCREMGIRTSWNWLWGFPEEDAAEYERLRSWIPLVHHLQPPEGFGRIHLDRFSPLFEYQAKFGLENVRPSLAYKEIYPLPVKLLYDLAYYFDFDHRDGREPEQYTAGIVPDIVRWLDLWNDSGEPPSLVMADLGFCVAIHDTRPCRGETFVMLTGLEADVYRFVRGIRSHNRIMTHFSHSDLEIRRIEQIVRDLADKRLILHDAGRYLALACKVDRLEQDATQEKPDVVQLSVADV